MSLQAGGSLPEFARDRLQAVAPDPKAVAHVRKPVRPDRDAERPRRRIRLADV